jgi:sugar-specific transcriptional regulator TrmB
MKTNVENIQILIDLGLHSSEAKVYLTLDKIGLERAGVIAENAQVSRPDVYRALSNLHELGLVEKIIGNPMMFKSITIKQGVSILLKQKAKKYSELQLRSADLIKTYDDRINHHNLNVRKSKLVLVPSKQALIKRLKEAIDYTQKSIDVFTSCKRLKFSCHCLFDELVEAWERGVRGRAIINKTCEPMFDYQNTCWRKPYADIKYIDSFPKTVMAIYDSKEVFIFLENEADLTESSALWTDNSSLVSLSQYGFNSCWKKAKEKFAMETINK